MIKGFSRLLHVLFRVLDFLMLNGVLFIVKLAFHRHSGMTGYVHFMKYWGLLAVCWYAVSWTGGLYIAGTIDDFEVFSRTTVRIYLLWVCTALFCLFFFSAFELSHLLIFSTFAFFGAGLLINRILYIPVAGSIRQRSTLRKNVLVLGYNETAKTLVENLESENNSIIGYCENPEHVQEPSFYPILSNLDNAMEVAKKFDVNEIYCTLSPETFPQLHQLMLQADQACIHFRLVPQLYSFLKRPMHLTYFKNIPILFSREEPLEDYTNWYRKRFFDVVVSTLVILLILSWLVPLLSLIIRLESKGPAFFVQMRSGRLNRPFPCIKFRSMHNNRQADEKQASKDDYRITKVGRFIRNTSIDELPQFFNVFLGEMSISGPRPHMIKHTEAYSQLIGQYMIRQFLRPGVTGWAQVNGLRGETRTTGDMAARVEHDIWYMENWSMWLDIRVIILTFIQVFKGHKNAR